MPHTIYKDVALYIYIQLYWLWSYARILITIDPYINEPIVPEVAVPVDNNRAVAAKTSIIFYLYHHSLVILELFFWLCNSMQ